MALPQEIILPLAGILGLILGSFYTVCIARGIAGESIIFPASHCPHCSQRLRPWELIPILSCIFLRGKCASCGANIPLFYPAIESVSAFYAMALASICSVTPLSVLLLILGGIGIVKGGIFLRSRAS